MIDHFLTRISSRLNDHYTGSGRTWSLSGKKWGEYRHMQNRPAGGWVKCLAPRPIRVSPSWLADSADSAEVASLQAEMAGLRAMESQVARSLSAMKIKKVCLIFKIVANQ